MKKILILAAALLTGVAANAQSYGVVNWYSDFWVARAHQYSTFDTNLSTARSAAMGGAFTSLGADLSSLHINPAGLGMYRSSDFGITLGPSIGRVANSMRGENTVSDSRTALAVNNFGTAFNLFEGSGATTSFTLGMGYSRLADYNYRSRMNIANGYHSILEMFDRQVEDGSVNNREGWGAYLSQLTAMIRTPEGGEPYIPVLSTSASVAKKMSEISRGSAGEYTVGGGWNFRNQLYFGFSLGIIDIYQDREMTYSEDYSNNEGAEDPALYMDYTQRVKTVGNGFNMKLGLVYRPVPELRLGVAFHTPTVATVRDYADYEMVTGYPDEELRAVSERTEEYQNDFYTPARLLVGASYTFFDMGVLAIDYERTFYNGMRLYGSLYDQKTKDLFRDEVKYAFLGSDALRTGLEVMATDELSLRFGYGFTRDGIKKKIVDNSLGYDLPMRRESSVFSAGFGVKIGEYTTLDMTYALLTAKMTDYNMFYYHEVDTDGKVIPSSQLFPGEDFMATTRQKLQRHSVMLSMSYRF
jgi:hypothetical protein